MSIEVNYTELLKQYVALEQTIRDIEHIKKKDIYSCENAEVVINRICGDLRDISSEINLIAKKIDNDYFFNEFY